VAKLAGIPDIIIERAKNLVEELSNNDIAAGVRDVANRNSNAGGKSQAKRFDLVDLAQMSLFDTVKEDDIITELQELDVSNLTPMDALNTIYRLQNKLRNRW